MTQSVFAAIDYLQTLAGALDGVNFAPPQPVEGALSFPYAETIIRRMTPERRSGSTVHIRYTLRTRIYVQRFDVTTDTPKVNALTDAWGRVLDKNVTLNGTVNTIVPDTLVVELLNVVHPTQGVVLTVQSEMDVLIVPGQLAVELGGS